MKLAKPSSASWSWGFSVRLGLEICRTARRIELRPTVEQHELKEALPGAYLGELLH